MILKLHLLLLFEDGIFERTVSSSFRTLSGLNVDFFFFMVVLTLLGIPYESKTFRFLLSALILLRIKLGLKEVAVSGLRRALFLD